MQIRRLRRMEKKGHLTLYYADESRVSLQGYVPYGWLTRQERKDGSVFMPASSHAGVGLWAAVSASGLPVFERTRKTMDGAFVATCIEKLCCRLGQQETAVLVLDNAPTHRAPAVKAQVESWQRRGLFLLFLPVYSPELNPCERLWLELKQRWLTIADYKSLDSLEYACWQAISHQSINIANYFC